MRTTLIITLWLAMAWTGCAGEGTLEEVDPDAAPQTPTYAEHIAPIMKHRCTACHAPDAQPGEVEGYGYETCDKVVLYWQSIEDTVFKVSSMPPAGAERLTSSEKLTLRRWERQGLDCGNSP